MRPYYHYEEPRTGWGLGARWTPTGKVIIGVTCAAYLVQVIVDRVMPSVGGVTWTAEWFGYSRLMVARGAVWQPLTYMLVHGGLLHLLGNMVGLFFFSGDVEERMGRRQFMVFYVMCGLGGAALGTAYAGPVVGASGAVYGVLIAFAMYFPDARVMLFPLPIGVQARYIAILWVFISVAGSVAGGGGVAHLAHVGGIVVAGAWVWGGPRLRGVGEEWERRRAGLREKRSAGEQREMDRILAKVHENGIHSLSEGEREFLEKMSRRYRD